MGKMKLFKKEKKPETESVAKDTVIETQKNHPTAKKSGKLSFRHKKEEVPFKPQSEGLSFAEQEKLRQAQQSQIEYELSLINPNAVKQLAMQEDLGEDYKTLESLLMEDAVFKQFITYQNQAMTTRVLNEMTGFNIIYDIEHEYPNYTDIIFDGAILIVETGNNLIGQVNYARCEDPYLADIPEFKDLKVVSRNNITRLVDKFAIREQKSFSQKNPLFDGFANNLRIAATYPNLSEDGITVAIRHSLPRLELNEDNWHNYAPDMLRRLLFALMATRVNLIVSGGTGTGKTTLLKLLVKPIPIRDHMIVIEDIPETQLRKLFPTKKITSWLTHEHIDRATKKRSGIGIIDLVVQALRHFPQWIFVAETRDAGAFDLFQGAKTGHYIMTTLHATSNALVPYRYYDMVSMAQPNKLQADFVQEFYDTMDIGIHVIRHVFPSGRSVRYPDEIVYFASAVDSPDGKGKQIPLFRQTLFENENGLFRSWESFELPEVLKKRILFELSWKPEELDLTWKAKKRDNEKLDEPLKKS